MRETRAMENLVNSLDQILARMKEQKRQLEQDLAQLELQKRDAYRVIWLYPNRDNKDDSDTYEI